MRIKRTAKHLVLVIVTALVLVIMLFIPDFFLNCLDKRSASVVTEKSSPVTLELKSGLSLCQKAYVASNGVRELTGLTKSNRLEAENEAWKIWSSLTMNASDIGISDHAVWEGADYSLPPPVYDTFRYSDNGETRNIIPLRCTMNETEESCIVWYIVMGINNLTCIMVLDDETMTPLDISISFQEYPLNYIGDDILMVSQNLMDCVGNYYNNLEITFLDDEHVTHEEADGCIVSQSMAYVLTMKEIDGLYFFRLNVNISEINFSIISE